MSNKTVLIWLAVALFLGGAAWLVLGRGGGGTGRSADATFVANGERVFTFLPSQATGMTVSRSGSPIEFLRRDPETGEWSLTLRGAGGKDGPAWPMGAGKIDNLLRDLTSTRTVAKPEATMELGASPTLVTVSLSTGQEVTFRLAERTLGGSGLIVVDEVAGAAAKTEGGAPAAADPARRAVINDKVHDIFRKPGPTAWREAVALPGVDGHASRIRITNEKGPLAIGRTGARWTVTEPPVAAGAAANPEAVRVMLANLAAIKIVDFRDSASAEAIDKPLATVEVETDVREAAEGDSTGAAAPKVTVSKRELAVGGPCGAGGSDGERRVARLDGVRTVCIDARSLATLTFDAAAYISTRITEVAKEDVGTVLIEPTGEGVPAEAGRVVRRQLDKWVVLDQAGNETVLADAGAMPIDAMLAFLTSPPKDIAGFDLTLTPPPNFAPLGRVTMLSIGGSPLENLEIGLAPDGRVAARTGKVFRMYPADRVPELLAGLLKRTKTSPGAGGAAEPAKKPSGEK